MKLAEIITRVQRQFGDDVQSQITTDDIVRWVNDACIEIANDASVTSVMQRGRTSVLANQSEYALPADLLKLRSVRVNGMKLRGTTYEQISEAYEAEGNPDSYWVLEGKLYLFPVPTSDLGTMDVYYVKAPDKLDANATDREPDVPKIYHNRIVEYCIAQAAELDDDLDHYNLKMAQFRDGVSRSRGDSENPEGDGFYPSITYVREYDD